MRRLASQPRSVRYGIPRRMRAQHQTMMTVHVRKLNRGMKQSTTEQAKQQKNTTPTRVLALVVRARASWGAGNLKCPLLLIISLYEMKVEKTLKIFQSFRNVAKCGSLQNEVSFGKGHFAMGPKRDPNPRTVGRKLLERHAFIA